MSKKNKRVLVRLACSIIFLVFGSLFRSVYVIVENDVSIVLCVVAWIICGYDVIFDTFRKIINLNFLDESFLMTVATIGALSLGEYLEAVGVMLLYQLGEVFQRYAVGKSRNAVASLLDMRPETANLLNENGEVSVVPLEDVGTGNHIIIRPGERVPLDGIVVEGQTLLDTSALTGESIPREVSNNDTIVSGCINLTGVVTVNVTKVFSESTVTKILYLVESASEKKANVERFITRFARIYTPVVVGMAVILCLVPTCIWGSFNEWFRRALMLLMVACPCALVISVPLGYFGGIGAASRNGVLIKGSEYMEILSRVTICAADKTGTLTCGSFNVAYICTNGISKTRLISLAAAAEVNSAHPLARSIVSYATEHGINIPVATSSCESAGHGVNCNADGVHVIVGSRKYLASQGVPVGDDCGKNIGTCIHVAIEHEYAGTIILADSLKSDSVDAVSKLHNIGIKQFIILTGDSREAANLIADTIGADNVIASLLPPDKVSAVESLMNNGKVMFIGDGINDAPVLARADVGIAMGVLGSDAAIEAADVVIMDDNLLSVVNAIKIARKTCSIVRQNIILSITVKVATIMCAALIPGMNMLIAIFSDVGVMAVAVLNSLRTLRIK